MRAGRTGTLKARALRLNVTEAEKLLWSRLRGGQLGHSFRRQHPIPPYIVDFACIAAHLIIEADGGHHAAPDEHDRRATSRRRVGAFCAFGTTTFVKTSTV
jgi:very-short-patch-repair endonuclease